MKCKKTIRRMEKKFIKINRRREKKLELEKNKKEEEKKP